MQRSSYIPLLVAGGLAALAGCNEHQAQATRTENRNAAQSAAPAAVAAPTGLPNFTALVDQFGNAVVNVEVVGMARQTADSGMAPSDAPLRDFFKRFGIPIPGEGAPNHGSPPVLHGAGSGFIVSHDGYILTNAHVVADADEVTVKLTDRREFPAKVIGSDARTDVAVIKIEAEDLPIVRIGDQTTLKTGEWVLAIGSPFGLDNTATAGIVSATARAVPGGMDVPFIQTDVPVNPGNSGGPLFNLQGEVVGINSMIFSQNGGYMGISFAIPIEVAMHVHDQLIQTGHVVRGRIGVMVQNVDGELAQPFGLDRPRGALVSAVENGSPAARAGVKPGDVILKVDDHAIDQSNQLSSFISQRHPGDETTLTVWRAKQEQQLQVRVAELKEDKPRSVPPMPQMKDDASGGARLGLAVKPLTPEEKKSLGTDGSVVVGEVSGAAARAGIQPGDVVLGVNDRQVKTVADLRSASKDLPAGEPAALLIERQGARIYVPVRVG
ncbi:DegQ family serine endoprotease [Steroidobacter cummioxidans]|uniref:DegQ family serine endoprotease n=1 Tax=Steroidobacter cummioxidans TaxID=1803913 RepID=UPI0019D4E439|nr:DegQ family serine endoprotease [Steroidobacter cummioxidans]